MIVAA
jgi:hypothetical protein